MAVKFSGITSGDPTVSSGIFWTRTSDSVTGAGLQAVVTLQVSEKSDFSSLITAPAVTDPNRDFTVKVDLGGLRPGVSYFYRFLASDGTLSDTGFFKTAPDPTSGATVKFGMSGDVDGYMRPFWSTQDLKTQKLDFFMFNGDTMYETVSGSGATLSPKTADPYKDPAQALKDYRRKYLEDISVVPGGGTYPGITNLYQAQSLVSAWDNHELGNGQFINGGAPLILESASGKGTDNTAYDVNKTGFYINDSVGFAAMQQAFLEYLPIRTPNVIDAPSDPRSDGTLQLYGAQQWGKNTIAINLDTRTYRDVRLTTAAGADDGGARADNPDRTYLGATQLAWLKQTLLDSQKAGLQWKFIATSDPIDQIGALGGTDDGGKSWIGGYRAERNDLLKFIADNKISNVVFMSCDDHQTRINEVQYVADPTKPTTYSRVPGVISVVDGPIGATGPDTVTDHSFANLNKLATDLAAKQLAAGVDPVGLDALFPGLKNVVREGDATATTAPKPVDFYSPDTFNYATFAVDANGLFSFELRGIDSTQKDAFPTTSPANRSLFSFQVDGTAAGKATRLLDSVTGTHLITTDAAEVAALVARGFKSEGTAFNLGVAGDLSIGTYNQVTRLRSANGLDHLLTTSAAEIAAAKTAGYQVEGVAGWMAAQSALGMSTAVNRLFNGVEHLYTSSAGEAAALVAGGWRNEGVLGYVA